MQRRSNTVSASTRPGHGLALGQCWSFRVVPAAARNPALPPIDCRSHPPAVCTYRLGDRNIRTRLRRPWAAWGGPHGDSSSDVGWPAQQRATSLVLHRRRGVG